VNVPACDFTGGLAGSGSERSSIASPMLTSATTSAATTAIAPIFRAR
jgi:hypothetical protein